MSTTSKATEKKQIFQEIDSRFSFPKEEEKTLSYWEKIDAFQTSLKKSEGKKPFSFFDGPPFATGLPHYGHLLAGTIKDIVTRYAHQTGHYVERRFGWDTHGLPIEFEIEKMLGIKSKDEILKMGIKKYNEHCRSIVMKYSSEWRKVVNRIGRWIDFDNDYKTMNLSYMESVWWVLKELYKKGLVYRGSKVMPYSTACTTTLSNFEANLDYRDVIDPAIIISFPIIGDKDNAKLLGWTTTPWTLPSNLALVVHPKFEYVKILDKPSGETWIVAKSRLSSLYKKNEKNNYKVLGTMKGTELKGLKYKPLFDYFYEQYKTSAYRVICDEYVTNDSGTGIVHSAPGFGEDDYRTSMKNKICKKEEVLCPVDEEGKFSKEVTDFAGMYVKDADKLIIKKLKENKRLINQSQIKHSYPFCWRSKTPLIYKAIPSWFVNVEQLKDRLLVNNQKTYWVPDFVKSKRFHNWLEDARDWAISRSRYWGTPIPIWVSDDYEEIEVCGSVEDLETKAGLKPGTITDLHRDNIDHITIPSKKGKGVLKRIPEVFDCWFESGSMPYAQNHYPFENKEKWQKSFPADFIAEGVDQTRGWFYTLLVLGTALFDTAPFKNLIVNGLVLAADGKKMSKSLRNYPNPSNILDKYGADALRLYLINSPVVRAEKLKFKEEGVESVVQDIFKPWYNAFRFFIQNSNRYYRKFGKLFTSKEAEKVVESEHDNLMDKWIISLSQSLIKYVKEEMKAYRLFTVVPILVSFIDKLTNWYVRLNRPRIKGDTSEKDWHMSLCTLYYVLLVVTRVMSPFTPFLTEYMYQSLKKLIPENEREESCHYVMLPEPNQKLINLKVEKAVEKMQSVVVSGRKLRDIKGIGMKYPVKEYLVCNIDKEILEQVKSCEKYIKQELNSKTIKFISDVNDFMELKTTTNNKKLGKSLGKLLRATRVSVEKLSHQEIIKLMKEGSIELMVDPNAQGNNNKKKKKKKKS